MRKRRRKKMKKDTQLASVEHELSKVPFFGSAMHI